MLHLARRGWSIHNSEKAKQPLRDMLLAEYYSSSNLLFIRAL